MKNIKTFVGTFAAGAAIVAASLLTVAAPASAATQAAVQAGTRTAPQEPGHGVSQRREPVQRSVTVPKRQSSPVSAEEQREQQLQREKGQKQPGQQPQQQPGQGSDPGGFLPDPPVVTPEG